MALIVERGDPRDPRAIALLEASRLLMESLFDPQDNHYLSNEELCAPNIRFFIAHDPDSGTILGCGALAVHRTWGEVKSMFVQPEARGHGIADRIMDRIEEEARQLGLKALMLETGDLLLEAQRLYGRKGFAVRGPFGEYSESDSSIFMEKALG